MQAYTATADGDGRFRREVDFSVKAVFYLDGTQPADFV